MHRLTTLSVALLLAGGTAALPVAARAADPIAPRTAPKPVAAGAARAVSIPYERFVLPNGLTVLVYPDPGVPTVFVGMWYRTGSKDEPPGRSGFAHLFEHLMFQQTANRKGEYLGALAAAGAVGMNGSTDLDFTNYYETVPSNALDLALWMESDRMGYLDGGITQAVLDEQRRVVENEKRQAELRPEERARERFLAGFYPAGHPYAHSTIGSMADLDAATLPDVKRWFVDHYGASNAVLVLAGDIDVATAREKVARYFGAIRPGVAVSQPVQWTPVLDAVRRDVVRDRFAGDTLTRTWPVANDDPRETTLLQLAARALAGPKTALLNRELIDGRRIATGVSASVAQNRLASTFTVEVGLRPGVSPDAARQALDAAMRGFLADGPAPDRLAAVVTASDTAILRSLESSEAVGTWLVTGEVEHGDPLFFLKQRDWIAQATPAEVRAVAARWLARPFYETALLATPDRGQQGAQADVDRTRMPVPGPARTAIAFPPVTQTTLANGLRVVVAERHRLPLVEVRIQFPTGAFAETSYGRGVAAAAFDLLADGSRSRDATALTRAASAIGADFAARTGATDSGFAWRSTPDRLDASFALAADMLRDPRYAPAAVAEAKAALDRRVDAAARDPLAGADALFARIMWGDADPRGDMPRRDDARTLSRDAIVRFHDHEVGPLGATLYLVGDVSPAEAARLAERHFGNWRANVPAAPVALPPAPAVRGRIVLVDAPGAAQSSITVGTVVPPFDKEAAATEALVAATLAGASSGRLNMDLREDKGWTYGFSGGIDDAPAGDRLFTATGTVQADRTADSIAAIRTQIADFVGPRPMTQAELDDDREAAIRAIPLALSTNGAWLASMATSASYGLPLDRAAGTPARLAAVTLDGARRTATRLFRPGELVWLVVGDLKTIEPAIRALALAPVEVRDADGRRLR